MVGSSLLPLKAHLAKATQTDEAWQTRHPPSQSHCRGRPALPLEPAAILRYTTATIDKQTPASPWIRDRGHRGLWSLFPTLLLGTADAAPHLQSSSEICHQRPRRNTPDNWAGPSHPGDVLSGPGSSGRPQKSSSKQGKLK